MIEMYASHIRTLAHHILSNNFIVESKGNQVHFYFGEKDGIVGWSTHKKIMTFASEYGNVISITCTHAASGESRHGKEHSKPKGSGK